MNTYPEWWDKTVTLYNKYQDPTTNLIKWYKHTLNTCFWKYVHDKGLVGSTVIETNYTICRIPKDDAYLETFEWKQLPNDLMQDYFTLSVGDVIVLGEVDDVIDEYTSGHRSSDMIKKYKTLQGCMIVDTASNNTGVGRLNEHYLAKGV